MIILGIDPALTRTGWGVVSHEKGVLKFIACGQIKTNDKMSLCERLGVLSAELKKVITEYDPDEAAIEETFVNKSGQSTLKLGQARGALILTVSQTGLPLFEYAANLVKKTVTGNGHAEKEQVQAMVKMLLPHAKFDNADAADALAIAITHSMHNKVLLKQN
jgi:crossover junction endodeoxyribonuclease RuvC